MSIVDNKKAFHDYFIEERYEAGLVLEGWEVKAIRAGRVQLKEAYVVAERRGALRDRHARERPADGLDAREPRSHALAQAAAATPRRSAKLIGKVEQRGYTLVPLNLHYTKGRVKLDIGLAKGKKQHDKRETEKERDWQREQQRLMRRKAWEGRRAGAMLGWLMGFEPTTTGITIQDSTAELQPPREPANCRAKL